MPLWRHARRRRRQCEATEQVQRGRSKRPRRRGEAALAAGEVAAVLVAGGQGTRLGFDQPKGMFEIGPVSGRTLFQFFADRLIAVGETFGSSRFPWYIMTSDATDAETHEYFATEQLSGMER